MVTKQKVLIIGASGLVGGALYRVFSNDWDVTGTYYDFVLPDLEHLDIRDQAAVEDCIQRHKPHVILLPAACPNVEYCESSPQETKKINVDGSKYVIEAAKRSDAKVVFFSSDYIFNGKSGPYKEIDSTDPLNEYGKQKIDTERFLMKELSNYLIIRTTVVYGWERRGKNFVVRLLEDLRAGRSVRVPRDQIGSPTYVETIAQGVKALVEKDEVGIFNIAGPENIDRASFAKLVAQVWDLNESLIQPVLTSELQLKAQRPLVAGLSIVKVQSTIDTNLLSPREGLRAMRACEGQQIY